MAVFATEALPEGHSVDGLVLLSASISTGYDLTKALSKSRQGLVNFYSPADVGFLVIGTTLAGNVDGMRGPAAGAAGFDKPKAADPAEKRQAYGRLYEVKLTDAMTGGDFDAHASTTRSGFVRQYVAPWVISGRWPAGATSYRGYSAAGDRETKTLARNAP